MVGAILGDVIGSRFEFHNYRNIDFTLFTNESTFTDDTVCTIAFMDWCLHAKEKTPETATMYLHKWCNKYPYSGYGGRFYRWVHSNNPRPYGSYGNGAAMRISPIGYIAKDLDELNTLSDMVTGITHNHPEGLKGARVVATCIYMARHNASREDIREYAISQYPEISGLNYETLKRTFEFNETCQGTVPQAIYCFLISDSFEDCIRKTISIGGDCDTTAAMSGAIAEAFYDIPNRIKLEVRKYLTKEMLDVIDEFYKTELK